MITRECLVQASLFGVISIPFGYRLPRFATQPRMTWRYCDTRTPQPAGNEDRVRN
jgi:hypothetical protein